MIITSEREHDVHMQPGHFWYCGMWGHALRPTDFIHYRTGCARCFVGFMENARTKNRFTVGGETKAAYNLEEARLWFFGLYKGDTDEGE